MGTKVTLGGKTVIGQCAWTLRAGTSPVVATFDMAPADADALLEGAASPIELVIESTDLGRSGRFRELYALYRVASDVPAIARIAVADRRWKWPYKLFKRHMNITRKVGTTRLVSPEAVENQQVVPDVAYAPWSIIGGKIPYTAKNVLNALSDAIEGNTRLEGLDRVGTVPIQDLELEGPLDECVERALAYLPGVNVRVDADGTVVFFDTANGREAKQYRGLQEAVNMGHVEPVTFGRVRPSEITVWFTPEIECRIDFEEVSSTGFTFTERSFEEFLADNVAPIPDPYLTISGQQLTQGTYATFPALLRAWGSFPVTGEPLDFAYIRKAFVPFIDLWAGAELLGAPDPAADWSSRIATIERNYRQTFRINRRLMDRLYDIRAYRVGTQDPVTGTRGKASVYADYSYLATMRSLLIESNYGKALNYVNNVATYPAGGVITSTTRGAPATLSVLDADQGILGIEFLADRFKVYEMALPSQVELDGDNVQPGTASATAGPSPYIRANSGRPVGFDMLGVLDREPQLTATAKMIFIVTVVPGAPNGTGSLVGIKVAPSDVPDFPGRGSCFGPPMDVRINPAMETARIPWTDQNGDTIRSFITGSGKDDEPPASSDEILKLAMNVQQTDSGASLTDIARGAAARIWASMRDRDTGAATTGFAPPMRPDGALDSVTHMVDAGTGAVLTAFSLPERVEPLNIGRYLDASVKRFIYRIANPGRV